MAIWSMISSNMRKKKGNFIGVFILSLIIAITVSSIVSAYLCGKERYAIASKESNAPDIMNYVSEADYDSNIAEKLKKEDEVKDVENIKTLVYGNGLKFGEKELGSPIYLYEYEPDIFSFQLENGNRMNLPKKGEIYMPKAIGDTYNCKIGDKIEFTSENKNYTFTISDFFEDTVLGSSMIGMKRVYINSEDFNDLYTTNSKDFKHVYTLFTMLEDDAKKDSEVIRNINANTGVQKYGDTCAVISSFENYTFLMPNIISAALIGFAVLLFIILIIVLAQSISASIETEYKNYGILKAMGFSSIQLRSIILFEYILSSIIGMIIGTICGEFLIRTVGELVLDGTGLFWLGTMRFKECSTIFIGILLFMSLFIVFITRKVVKISPVRAIAFGNAPVYFSSRIDFLVGSLKKMPLSIQLGFKQVITHIKQSSVLIIIIAILSFFTVSMYSLGSMLDSDMIEKTFNVGKSDISIYYDDEKKSEIDLIKDKIEKYSHITLQYKQINCYKTVDNANLQIRVADVNYVDMEEPKEGRNPKYDNEVLTTPIMSEELGKGVGDTVEVEDNKGNKAEYMIVGIKQNLSDTGRNITMLESGMKRLNKDYNLNCIHLAIENEEKTEEIIDDLKSIYGENSSSLEFDNNYKQGEENYMIVDDIQLVTKIIFILSAVIVAIIVLLVCNKSVRKIRTDIGIFKAQGFTNNQIRCQVAVQFLIIALVGSIVGTILNIFFNDKMLCVVFKMAGIVEYVTNYTAMIILIPIITISVFSFIASWLITGKVKKITPKNLISE